MQIKLLSLSSIAIIGAVLTVIMAWLLISSNTDPTAKGTIAAGAITVLGVIFADFYKEIASFYKERSRSISKKWKLIFPFIKSHYNPWIGASNSWLNSLENLDVSKDIAVARVLYLTTLFYGIRMRFLNDGGVLLLSTNKEEEKVTKAYNAIKGCYKWAGPDPETQLRTSFLQKYFLDKTRDNTPLVFDTFYKDMQTNQALTECNDLLKKWVSDKNNVENLKKEVKAFATTFKGSIDKLYTAWGD